ncbi:MAG: hypothetical protein HEQ34_13570 [Sphingorhabdus sp.]|uniref:hypothetical protein n=1 Tax=Sphingorhabdus sp. TaxID=1902408 RepID=UPI0025E56AD0|nr:hypothetical protein [Sphingorhabdus sp.]MCO4092963.1 hypothetical protein [Sphingorhabdus sp.]
MPRHPLTVYLDQPQLLAIEKQARAAGMAKSAWAGKALVRALGEHGSESALLLEQTLKVRATLEELVAAHPQKEVIRKKTELRIERYLAKAREAVSA